MNRLNRLVIYSTYNLNVQVLSMIENELIELYKIKI